MVLIKYFKPVKIQVWDSYVFCESYLIKISTNLFFSGFKISDNFLCGEFQSFYGMTGHSFGGDSLNSMPVFEMFSSEFIKLLFQFKNIFNDKVKSNFESEDEMFAFTKQLLIKFFNIQSLNAFSVRFFTLYSRTFENISKEFIIKYNHTFFVFS